MIKGFCKEAVIVKCNGQLIDEAIFILKKDSSLANKKEAKRKRSFMKILDEE